MHDTYNSDINAFFVRMPLSVCLYVYLSSRNLLSPLPLPSLPLSLSLSPLLSSSLSPLSLSLSLTHSLTHSLPLCPLSVSDKLLNYV